MIHKSHTLYTPEDFTEEEIDRQNRLAVLVIDGGLSVCKICGGYESELTNSCRYTQQKRYWDRLDFMEGVRESGFYGGTRNESE